MSIETVIVAVLLSFFIAMLVGFVFSSALRK